MKRFGIIGINWQTSGSRLLERLTIAPSERQERLPELRDELGAVELIYLATCNRVEIIFVEDGTIPFDEYRPRLLRALTGREPEAGEAQRTLRAWRGEGALEHLLMVASGLDSAQLGEYEIRGQLRDSHRLAEGLGLTGPRLDWAIEQALRVAREVQQRTGVSGGRTSLAEIGLAAIRRHLGTRPGTVALVGVSAMTRRCAEELRPLAVPMLVVNRTLRRAEEMAQPVGASAMALEDFCDQPPSEVTAVALATGSQEALLSRSELQKLASASTNSPIVIDFGVPANADGEAAAELGLPYLDMNTMTEQAAQNRQRRVQEAAAARELIDQALERLRKQVAERTMAPVLGELARKYRTTAEQGIERLLRRELQNLTDDERQALERWAFSMAKRLAHIPTRGLRALAAEHGTEAVETFLGAADQALTEELHHAVARPRLFTVDEEELA